MNLARNYTYDKNGNILTEDIYNNYIESQPINELKEYTYDTLARLTNVKVTDRTNENNISETSYTYDKVGNRLTKTKGETTESYEYNNLNELLNVKNGDNIIKEYTYDANGNTLKETNGNEVINYQYNINNQMTKYENSNGVREENEYNIDEQRVKKVVTNGTDSKVNNYYYDRGNLLYTTDDNNTMLTSNILNLEGNVISSARKNDDYLYFFTYNKDSRNSTSSIVDFANEALVSYKYDEFGETQELTGISTTADYPVTEYDYRLNSIDNEICYTGGVYDKETGEYYLNARHYDPTTARFTSLDTYRGEKGDPLSLHLYNYCQNDPISYIDPTGHSRWSKKLKLWDYYIIHKIVQSIATYDLRTKGQNALTEIFVSKKGKRKKGQYGYLDIYNGSNNTFYEVKTRRQIDSRATMNQIARYKKWHTNFNKRKVRLGYNGFIVPRDFYYGAHKIHMEYRGYSWQTTGRIYYETSFKKSVRTKRMKSFLKKGAMAAIAFAGGWAASGISSIGGSLIPGLKVVPVWW